MIAGDLISYFFLSSGKYFKRGNKMITPFNLPWFVLITLSFSLPFFIARKLEGKSRKEKLFFVKWFSIVSALLWVLYKYLLSIDPDFSFVFWKELPLQPCNTMLWLGIIACILDNGNYSVMSRIT